MGKSQKKNGNVMIFISRFRHIDDHFTNLYPQLIKKHSMLNKVQDFLTYV